MVVEVASLRAVLALDDRSFNQGLRNADNRMSGFDRSMSNAIGKWKEFGRQAQIASIPIGLALGKGVSDAMGFDSALSEISARTGAVGDDLAEVELLALQMGAATKFSATDAANGMLELMASGDSLEQAMLRINDVMTLATVGNINMKQAADGLTDVMAAMGVDVEYSGDVVEHFSQAASSSSATVADMMEAMATGGNAASNFGINVMDTAAIMAVFAENGIKGSEAGNGLRTMLLNMDRPTEQVAAAWDELGTSLYDADGNARDFNTVLLEMNTALDSKSAEERNQLIKDLGGSYAFTHLSALLAAGGIDSMRETMVKQRDATEIAEAKMNTFEGSLTSLQGSLETLNIKAFRPFMNETLKPIVDDFIQVINQVADFAEANPELTNTVIMLGGALVVGTAALTGLGMAVSLVTSGIGALIATALSPLGFALAVGAALVLAYTNNWLGFRDFVDGQVRPAIDRIIAGFRSWHGVLTNVTSILDGIMSGKYNVDKVAKAAGSAFSNEVQSGGFNEVNEFTNNFTPFGIFSNAPGFSQLSDAMMGTAQLINETRTPGGANNSVNIGSVQINAGSGADGRQIANDFRQEINRRGIR